MADIDAFYFGCWGESGHFLWAPGMKRVPRSERLATPWGVGLDSKRWDQPEPHLEKLNGWTAVGVSDRTVDQRGGSISVFAFHADLTLHEALVLAGERFPEVVARVGRRLTPAGAQ